MGLILLAELANTIRAVWHCTGYFFHERKLILSKTVLVWLMFLEVLLQQVKQAASFLSVLKYATLKLIWIYSLSFCTAPRRSFPLPFQTKMYLHLVHIMYCTCCKTELCIWLTALNFSPAPEQLQLTQWWWLVPFMDLELTLMLGLTHPIFH